MRAGGWSSHPASGRAGPEHRFCPCPGVPCPPSRSRPGGAGPTQGLRTDSRRGCRGTGPDSQQSWWDRWSPATTASTLHSLLRGPTTSRLVLFSWPRLEVRWLSCGLWVDISIFTAARAHHTLLLCCKGGTANQSMWLFFVSIHVWVCSCSGICASGGAPSKAQITEW